MGRSPGRRINEEVETGGVLVLARWFRWAMSIIIAAREPPGRGVVPEERLRLLAESSDDGEEKLLAVDEPVLGEEELELRFEEELVLGEEVL